MKKYSAGVRKTKENAATSFGFHWGEPNEKDGYFQVTRFGDELEITAGTRLYSSSDHPCDLIWQYETARKNAAIGKESTCKDSPHIRFANANTDDELIEFVRNFGPVVAKSCKVQTSDEALQEEQSGKLPISFMKARQDLAELRNERTIYQSAMRLIVALAKPDAEFDLFHAKQEIVQIAPYIPRGKINGDGKGTSARTILFGGSLRIRSNASLDSQIAGRSLGRRHNWMHVLSFASW